MLRRLAPTVLALGGSLALIVLACKEDAYPESCRAIIDACHDNDTDKGPIHACETFAEEAMNEGSCAEKKSSCIKTCQSPTTEEEEDGGAGTSSGSTGMGAECQAIIDACVDYDFDAGPSHECVAAASKGKEGDCALAKANCLLTCARAADPDPECTTFGALCHDLDRGPGPQHECHVFAESGHTKEECAKEKARCSRLCGAGDGG